MACGTCVDCVVRVMCGLLMVKCERERERDSEIWGFIFHRLPMANLVRISILLLVCYTHLHTHKHNRKYLSVVCYASLHWNYHIVSTRYKWEKKQKNDAFSYISLPFHQHIITTHVIRQHKIMISFLSFFSWHFNMDLNFNFYNNRFVFVVVADYKIKIA